VHVPRATRTNWATRLRRGR